MSYRAADADAGKRHLKMQQKVPNEVAAKRESEIGEKSRKRERDAALKGQQREERFYCILLCVCVCCMQPPSAVASFADGLVKVQHRPQGAAQGARGGGGRGAQSSGPKGTEWQRPARGNLLHFHIQLQLQQLQRFCIIKGSHKLPSHAQLKILIDD